MRPAPLLDCTSRSQAESDHHVKDTYNYVTVQVGARMLDWGSGGRTGWAVLACLTLGVFDEQQLTDLHPALSPSRFTEQTDIRMPRRQLRQLEDAAFNGAFMAAIEAAVQARHCRCCCCSPTTSAAAVWGP